MSSRFTLRLVPIVLAVAASAIAGAALAQGATQWGCDAPFGRTCYFSIQFATGGVRNFSLMSGRKTVMSGVAPGRDQYLVSVDAPNLGDASRCRQLTAVGHLCQRKVVDPSYND
jgi:hypothetical protein